MKLNLVLDGGVGRGAIWTGDDDAPFNNPREHLDRVLWDTTLDYLRVVDLKKYTLTVPAIPGTGSGQGSGGRNGLRAVSYDLGPHGQPGTPFTVAAILVDGHWLAFSGSIPVHVSRFSTLNRPGFARWLAFGFDATNFYVHEYSVQAGNAGTQVWEARPEQTFEIVAYITNTLLD